MYYPDPTQRPTSADYTWARELKAGDLGLRIEWALGQFALRGMWENEFCAGAGVNSTYIPLLRKKLKTHSNALRGIEWNRFLDHLEATQDQVPECLWAHQAMFPYDKHSPRKSELVASAARDMNRAGFTPYSLRLAMTERSGRKHSNLTRVEDFDAPSWQIGLSVIYEALEKNPLPDKLPGWAFPYFPKEHPELAAKQMERIWRRQEAANMSEMELSKILDRYDGGGDTPYLCNVKLRRGLLLVDEYRQLVCILFQPPASDAANQFSRDYQEFFPYSLDKARMLQLRTTRLGLTYLQIYEAGKEVFGKDCLTSNHPSALLLGKIDIPAQETWYKLVAACQQAETQMRQDFLLSWELHYGEAGEYHHLSNGVTPQEIFERVVRESEKIDPVPVTYLAPLIDAGITLGGRVGKPYLLKECGVLPNDSKVVDILSPLQVELTDGSSECLRPPLAGNGRLRIVIHTGEDGMFGPIRVMQNTDVLTNRYGAHVKGNSMGHACVRSLKTRVCPTGISFP